MHSIASRSLLSTRYLPIPFPSSPHPVHFIENFDGISYSLAGTALTFYISLSYCNLSCHPARRIWPTDKYNTIHSILAFTNERPRPRAFNLTRTTTTTREDDEAMTIPPSIVQKSNYSGDSPIKLAERFSSVDQFDGKHSISKSLSIHFRKMASYFS